LISFSLHVRLTGHFGTFWGGRQVDNSSVWATPWHGRDGRSSQALRHWLRDESRPFRQRFTQSVWHSGGGPWSTIRWVASWKSIPKSRLH
jgi:hypothetical protein